MHLSDFEPDESAQDAGDLSLADRWILSRLNGVVETVTKSLDEYKFNEAANALYQFVWHELCDWYLEIIKPVLYGTLPLSDGTTRTSSSRYVTTRFILWSAFNETLRLLHPFIPFVTEEIWDKLPGTEGSIMKREAEEAMKVLIGVVSGIRNIRGEMNVPPSLLVEAKVQSPDIGVRELLERHRDMIVNLCRLKSLQVRPPGKRPASCATSVFGSCTIFVSLKGVIDFELERGRLSKEIAKIARELDGIVKKLTNEDFLRKAPQEVVQKVQQRGERLAEKRGRLEEQLSTVRQIAGNS
jgi:valyl-tRNA synthetase